jgi:hypothetical protein
VAVTVAAEAESLRDANAESLWRREQTLLDKMQSIAKEIVICQTLRSPARPAVLAVILGIHEPRPPQPPSCRHDNDDWASVLG